MKPRFIPAGALLMLCVFAPACSRPQPASATGPYHYVSTEGGVTIESTARVRYDTDATVVSEDVQFGQVTAHIESRLDPTTLSARSYTMSNDPEEENPYVSISTKGASIRTKTGGRALVKAPAPGAPSWIFGNYASSYVLLPSFVRAAHPRYVNAYMPDVFHGRGFGFKLSVIPATAAPPAGVPANDASLALGSATHRRVAMVTVWYDPATKIVDAVNIGGGTAFVRKP